MRTTAAISIWIVRVSGTLQLVLGILFWTGHAYGYLPLHIINGVLIVLTLWTVAALALAARTRRGLAVFGVLWGLALPAFGLGQATVLVGPMHWIVRVVHLLMGLAAMGVAGTLGQAILSVVPPALPRVDRAGRPAVPSRVP
jgi:hypothetical protein